MTGTVKQIIEHLQNYQDQDDVILADIWQKDDILNMSEQDLSEEDAQKVLYELDRDHDANIGINWEVIDATIDCMKDRGDL